MNVESVGTVAVLGLGTMGHSIAQTFAQAGLAVRCYDAQPRARSGLVNRVRKNLEHMATAGVLAPAKIETTLARLAPCESEAEAVRPAQFIAEAVAEDLAVKRDLFRRLEPLTSPEAILASNSSSLPVTDIAAQMRHPERAILCHWFNPPHIIPVVEVAPGRLTTEETTQLTMALLKKVGKTPVRINHEIPGLVVNRVQMALRREIFDLLERGVASAEDIDRAIQGSMGLRLAALGPFQILDFAGLDVACTVYENLAPGLRSDGAVPGCIRDMLDKGHFGVKTGQGFYNYTPASAQEKQAQRDRLYLALVKLLRDHG